MPAMEKQTRTEVRDTHPQGLSPTPSWRGWSGIPRLGARSAHPSDGADSPTASRAFFLRSSVRFTDPWMADFSDAPRFARSV